MTRNVKRTAAATALATIMAGGPAAGGGVAYNMQGVFCKTPEASRAVAERLARAEGLNQAEEVAANEVNKALRTEDCKFYQRIRAVPGPVEIIIGGGLRYRTRQYDVPADPTHPTLHPAEAVFQTDLGGAVKDPDDRVVQSL